MECFVIKAVIENEKKIRIDRLGDSDILYYEFVWVSMHKNYYDWICKYKMFSIIWPIFSPSPIFPPKKEKKGSKTVWFHMV